MLQVHGSCQLNVGVDGGSVHTPQIFTKALIGTASVIDRYVAYHQTHDLFVLQFDIMKNTYLFIITIYDLFRYEI